MRTINVAQLGVGYWGPNLLRNLVAMDAFQVGTVVDISETRRSYVRSMYPGIRTSSRAAEVWDDPDIDAVVIATPANTHMSLVEQAISHGKHVLVEKPVAFTVADVDSLHDRSTSEGVVVMVGHTFLYNPAVNHLKGLIDGGELGTVRYLYGQRLNLGRIRSDVDVLWNLAPHDVSIVQYLLDDREPVRTTVVGKAYLQEAIRDVAFLTIEYPGDVLAHIHVSWLDPYRTRRLTVVGSQKMVVYDDLAEYKIVVHDKGIESVGTFDDRMVFDVPQYPSFNYRQGDMYAPRIEWREPLRVELEHFAACILDGVECLTDLRHARGVVRILSEAGEAWGDEPT